MPLKQAMETISAMKLNAEAVGRVEDKYGIEVNGETLQDNFTYIVKIIDSPSNDIPLGVSRWGGEPDLPIGVDFPENKYFYAQINFAEVYSHDVTKTVPSRGILYLFGDETITDNILLFAHEAKDLQRTPYPEEFLNDDALSDLKQTARLDFCSNFYFDYPEFNGDSWALPELLDVLPPEDLEKIYATLESGAYQPVEKTYISRFFGEPTDLQSMGDEIFDLEEMPDEFAEALMEEAGGLLGSGDDSPYAQFLFQLDHENGHIFVRVPDEDLKKCDFSRARMSFVGT